MELENVVGSVGDCKVIGEAPNTVVAVECQVNSDSLQWDEDFDNDDNSIWTASSPMTYDEGSYFKWRLQPSLLGNRIVWLADHDAELGGDGDRWNSLDEAKAAIQSLHDDIIASETSNADCTVNYNSTEE